MWKIGFLIATIGLSLTLGNTANSEQQPPAPGPAAGSSQPDQLTLDRLKVRIPPRSKARCDSFCRHPLTTTDRIFCCVTCLDAQWICREGSCFCEARVR
jgi:hypothetical protein